MSLWLPFSDDSIVNKEDGRRIWVNRQKFSTLSIYSKGYLLHPNKFGENIKASKPTF